jgi:hypothetical protein
LEKGFSIGHPRDCQGRNNIKQPQEKGGDFVEEYSVGEELEILKGGRRSQRNEKSALES